MTIIGTSCPGCGGRGGGVGIGCGPEIGCKPVSVKCQVCKGTGEATEEQERSYHLGNALRELRVGLRIPLRKAAADMCMKAVELSEMERGGHDDPASVCAVIYGLASQGCRRTP